MAEPKASAVGDPTSLYYQMAARWDLVDDILAGTQAMRNLGEERLPRAEGEDRERYRARLRRTFLHSGLADTLESIGAKPFCRPVHVRGDELSDRWWSIFDNVDLAGTDLTAFAHRTFSSALRYGLAHTLVDFPREPGLLSDQRRGSARPYWCLIEAPDLIGWRFTRTAFGEPILTQIRYVQEEVDPSGDYGDEVVLRCRVWNAPPLRPDGQFVSGALGTWERWVWKETKESRPETITQARYRLEAEHRTRREALEGGAWEPEESGVHAFPGIPLRTYYTNRTALMQAEPPFEELAVLNWEHWQSSSEQKNALAYARTPILFEAGRSGAEVSAEGEARTGDRGAGIAVGAGAFHTNPDPESKLSYVETSGAALGEGWQDLERIERRMEKLGMAPLDERRVARTATEASGDDEKRTSVARRWVQALERHFRAVVETTQGWASSNTADVYKLPKDFGLSIFSEFGVDLRSESARLGLYEARKQGDLDRRTFLEEIQRRGFLGELVDLDIVEDRLANESLELASAAGGPGAYGEEPEEEEGAAGGDDGGAEG